MTIKDTGGIFGRNPTFNDVTVEGTLTTTGSTSYTSLDVDNVNINGNTISTTNTNGALVLEPNGSGPVTVNGTNPRVRLIDSDATGTPEAEVSAAGGDLILTADRDNEKSDTLIRFLIDGSEKGRFLTSGGLTFNGDTAAANALDDYEEGTWTPTQGGTATLTSSLGLYTKIGRIVQLQFYLTYSSTGTADIASLPFTVNASAAQPLAVLRENNTQGTLWQGRLNNTATTMIIRRYDNANLAVSNGILVGSCTYTV